jgi:hypothetical protein
MLYFLLDPGFVKEGLPDLPTLSPAGIDSHEAILPFNRSLCLLGFTLDCVGIL